MAPDLSAALGIVTLALPSAATARSDSGRRDRERIAEAWRVVSAGLESRGAAIERVRELHSPDRYGDCPACRLSFDGEAQPWPCPTIAALDG